MSLQATANLIQQQGRGDDKMLVHMTPREVAGLEAIAKAKGGSLTINPQTGLPEAGFLDDILPIAASAALMYFGGPLGASIGQSMGLSGALAQGVGMGLLTGGATTLLTGDVNKGLKTGLTSGILSGGMAAMSGPGATDIPTTNVETTTPALQAASTPTGPEAFTYNAAGEMVPANYPAQVTGATNMPPEMMGPPKTSMNKGFTGNEKLAMGLGGAGLLSVLGSQNQGGVSVPTNKGTIRPYEYSTAMRTPQAGQSPYFQPIEYDIAGRPSRPVDTSERNYFTQGYKALPTYAAANGGEVPPQLDNMAPGGLAAIQGMRDGYGATQTKDGNIPQFAIGGLPESDLGGYSDGGRMLKGPGDGVSDSIPATINGKQPARLADGEFVIPARIVSELGNGSTDAGAKRLYAMMDRIQEGRKKTVGKDKVAVDSKAKKHLPA